jgi:hypothetical protein
MVRCCGVQDVALKKGMVSRVPTGCLVWGAGHMVGWLLAKHESRSQPTAGCNLQPLFT